MQEKEHKKHRKDEQKKPLPIHSSSILMEILPPGWLTLLSSALPLYSFYHLSAAMHLAYFILPFLCLFLSLTIRPISAALLFQPSFYAHLFSPIRSSVATSTTTTEQPVATMQPARVVAPRGLSGEVGETFGFTRETGLHSNLLKNLLSFTFECNKQFSSERLRIRRVTFLKC